MISKFQSLSSALWPSASTVNSGVQLLLSFLSLTICLFRLVLIVINLPMQCFSSMGLSSSISYIWVKLLFQYWLRRFYIWNKTFSYYNIFLGTAVQSFRSSFSVMLCVALCPSYFLFYCNLAHQTFIHFYRPFLFFRRRRTNNFFFLFLIKHI